MNLNRISKKEPHADARTTMTAVHEQKIKDINDHYKTLPAKELQLEQLSKKLRGLRNLYSNDAFNLQKQISSLQKEITDIRDKTELSEYLIKAPYYLQEYKFSTIKENNVHTDHQNKNSNQKKMKIQMMILMTM